MSWPLPPPNGLQYTTRKEEEDGEEEEEEKGVIRAGVIPETWTPGV